MRILTLRFQTSKISAKIFSKSLQGGFFLIHIENRVWKLLLDAPRPSIFKTFLYIALNQPDEGIRGFIIEKPTLAFNLDMSQPTIFRDLKFLKDNLLIHELKLVENSDFMANPYLVMNNGDRDARIAEWARRQRLDSAREQRLRKERHLRAFRKSKKQKN